MRRFAALAGLSAGELENPLPTPSDNPKRGRPPGDKDNDREVTTIRLSKRVKIQARRRLEDSGKKPDLSNLVEELLQKFIADDNAGHLSTSYKVGEFGIYHDQQLKGKL
jgi:hypothetical protein